MPRALRAQVAGVSRAGLMGFLSAGILLAIGCGQAPSGLQTSSDHELECRPGGLISTSTADFPDEVVTPPVTESSALTQWQQGFAAGLDIAKLERDGASSTSRAHYVYREDGKAVASVDLRLIAGNWFATEWSFCGEVALRLGGQE